MAHSTADGPTGVMAASDGLEAAAGAVGKTERTSSAVLADAASVLIWAKVGTATVATTGAEGIF